MAWLADRRRDPTLINSQRRWGQEGHRGPHCTPLIMAVDTISDYHQGLLDGIEVKQTAYALDRDSRKATLARFLKRASSGDHEEAEEVCRLAAWVRTVA
jgi:hypothetical protein